MRSSEFEHEKREQITFKLSVTQQVSQSVSEMKPEYTAVETTSNKQQATSNTQRVVSGEKFLSLHVQCEEPTVTKFK
jgi:hypothetical protein